MNTLESEGRTKQDRHPIWASISFSLAFALAALEIYPYQALDPVMVLAVYLWGRRMVAQSR